MRNLLLLTAAFAGLTGAPSLAGAQPIDPYTGGPAALPPQPEQPLYPAEQAPAQPEYPVQVQPAQPVQPAYPAPQQPSGPYYPPQQPGYYYPPAGYAAPIYSYPPGTTYYVQPVKQKRVRRSYCTDSSCAPKGPRPRMFSVGLRLSALALDQQINEKDVVLGGAGLQLRFRTRGRFGIEGAVDVLHGSFGASGSQTTPPGGMPQFHVDKVTRDSIPVTLSMLLYIFPNENERVFNIYFLGGVGMVATTMGLTDENGLRVKQEFTEWEGHLGLGAELRFGWLALQADLRGLALTRDDSDRPASYYTGVEGGPVPANSFGVQGNVGATLWF